MKNELYVSNLIMVMRQQLEAYKELLSLAEKKTDILVKGDVKLLGEITDIEQNLILKLGTLEEERFNLVSEIAKAHNKDISEAKADFLMEIIAPEDTEAFSTIYEELKTILPLINEKNKKNEDLITNALEYINFSIKLLTEAGEMKANYGADGANAKKAFHFIDEKA